MASLTIRIYLQVVLPGLDGSFDIPFIVEEDNADIISTIDMFRIDLSGLFKFLDALVELACLPVHNAQIRSYIRIIRFDGKVLPINLVCRYNRSSRVLLLFR